MSSASCLALARAASADCLAGIRTRLERLEAFYEPLDLRVHEREISALNLLVVRLEFLAECGGSVGEEPDLAVWGAPLPAGLDTPAALLSASDHDLRQIDGATAAIATSPTAAVLVNASAGPATLYEATSSDGRVWSTHAVAAGLLAFDRVQIAAEEVPSLLAFEFVGGDRTLIRGVRALAPATRVDISQRSVQSRCWWPSSRRWEPVAEDQAQAFTEDALERSLRRRLSAAPSVDLALTGGADSRVVALALSAADVAFSCFTWGEEGWPDVVGAQSVAATLGLAHQTIGVQFLDWEEITRLHDRDARFADGVAPLAPAEREFPRSRADVVGGMAGEIGRAFYYRDLREPLPADPTLEHLAACLRPGQRIQGASPEPLASAAHAARAWTIDALESAAGWRALDVLYAEQRVRRWGRAQIPCRPGPFTAAFAPTHVARGLASLPLDDRLTDGFHRRYTERRWPVSLTSSAPPAEARTLTRLARAALARWSPPSSKPVPPWDRLPEAISWLTDDVLASPLLVETMGSGWVTLTIRAIRAGDPHRTGQALQAAGVIRLDAALQQLPRSVGGLTRTDRPAV